MASAKRNTCFCVFLIVFLLGVCCGLVIEFESFDSNKSTVREGGRERIPTNDPTVMALAEWTVRRLKGHLVSVNSAEEQVVQGMIYFINLTMADKHKKDHVCFVKIWAREWLNSIKLLRHKCK